jgi:hypothetical protein
VPIKTEEIVIHSRRGLPHSRKATLVVCAECGHKAFLHYVLEGTDHHHLQCASCTTTYCDGGCEAAHDGKLEG